MRLNGVMKWLGLTNNHDRLSNHDSESPEINYRFYSLRGVRELRLAARACLQSLSGVTSPALVVQADDDPIVSPESGRLVLERLGSGDKVLTTLPFDRHLVLRGDGAEAVFQVITRFIDRILEPVADAA